MGVSDVFFYLHTGLSSTNECATASDFSGDVEMVYRTTLRRFPNSCRREFENILADVKKHIGGEYARLSGGLPLFKGSAFI
jgi:hypothetical protein